MMFYTSNLTEQHLKGLWFSCTSAELIQSVSLSHSTTVKIQLKMFTEALCKYPNHASKDAVSILKLHYPGVLIQITIG